MTLTFIDFQLTFILVVKLHELIRPLMISPLSPCLCQCMDLAEYRTLFVLSFTTPAFDPDVAPSFGTLLATINVALSMLSEVESHFLNE